MKKINNSEIDQIKNIDNPRFELNRLVGYKFNKNAEVYAEDNLGAYIIIEKNYLNSDETYIRFLMGCKRGCGSALLKEVIETFGRVVLLSMPSAGEPLLNYYRDLGLNEVVMSSTVYKEPRHFFFTDDIKLEEFIEPLMKKYGGTKYEYKNRECTN